MVPQFNGGAYNPAIANNGNPNTVYNTSPGDDQAIPYIPGGVEPLGGGEILQPNYGMLQPGQTVKPTFGERSAGPVVPEAMGTAAPQATPMPKPAVLPDMRKPMVPDTSSWSKPRAPEPTQPGAAPSRGLVSYGNITLPQVTDSNADRRSPMAITLPEIATPDGQLRSTSFGSGADYWRTRLESLNSTLPQIPIPGVTQPQPQPGGGTAPTGPTTPAQPERPRLPGLGTSTPDASGIVRGPDPIDYGRRAEVANGFGSGNFTGMGALLGLQGRMAGQFNSRVTDIYNGMYPEQRAQFGSDAATINNPDAPEADKQSAWQRLTAWLNKQKDEFIAEMQNLNMWDLADVVTGIPTLGNNLESLWNRISNNGNFSDTRPLRPGSYSISTGNVGGSGGMRSDGSIVVPNITTPNAPNHQAVRDTLNSLPNYNPNAPSGQGGGASGGTGGGNAGGSVGGGTGAGGSSRITNPWDQKPGSRLPRRPT